MLHSTKRHTYQYKASSQIIFGGWGTCKVISYLSTTITAISLTQAKSICTIGFNEMGCLDWYETLFWFTSGWILTTQYKSIGMHGTCKHLQYDSAVLKNGCGFLYTKHASANKNTSLRWKNREGNVLSSMKRSWFNRLGNRLGSIQHFIFLFFLLTLSLYLAHSFTCSLFVSAFLALKRVYPYCLGN